MSIDFPPNVVTREVDKDLAHLNRVLKLETFQELDEDGQLALIRECRSLLRFAGGSRLVGLLLNLKNSDLSDDVRLEINKLFDTNLRSGLLTDLSVRNFFGYSTDKQLALIEECKPFMEPSAGYAIRSQVAVALKTLLKVQSLKQSLRSAIEQTIECWEAPPF